MVDEGPAVKMIWFLLALILMSMLSCRLDAGPDSVLSHDAYNGAQELNCANKCHSDSVQPDPLIVGGTGTAGKHVAHVQSVGYGCDECHSGYQDSASHMDGTIDSAGVVSFSTTNPTGQWVGDVGPSSGSCASLNCHGTDTLEWYGTSTAGYLSCTSCHAVGIGSTRQVAGAGGDFGANSSIASGHVDGGSDPTRQQCLVCHDQSTHTAGTVRVKNADTGAVLVYDPTTPSGLESHCLSCHDGDGALTEGGNAFSPFQDGSTLGTTPYVAGTRVASYWSGTSTVHRDQGLTCAGNGDPATGCHGSGGAINAHGSVSKGLLSRNMTFPVPSNSPFVYDDFKLCFDCHASRPSVSKEVVLGYKAGGNYDVWWAPTPYYTTGIQSLFRDRYAATAPDYPPYWDGTPPGYNDTIWGDAFTPLHNYHLSPVDAWMQSVWSYRGLGVGRASCTTCHNVHGNSGGRRSTYDEMGITLGTGVSSDLYGAMAGFADAVLKEEPVNCATTCHGIAGATEYWHTPAGE